MKYRRPFLNLSNALFYACALSILASLGGCATRPINPPIEKVNQDQGYRDLNRETRNHGELPEILVVLAFSGGGTRAAAFSYGALETLRDIELVDSKGKKVRALDRVNLISGVSGGSFTALSYGLYGDKLFDFYDKDFLKRDIQGDIISRVANPINWSDLSSTGWGRSELAAQLYDEVLFHGATFEDLDKGSGPTIMASATDISSGGGFTFSQTFFDYLCSDLSKVPVSRAASASSAVPFVLSPVTLNNYGGTCQFVEPDYLTQFNNPANAPRPAARLITQMQDLRAYHNDKENPYIHLVDGGLADNLAIRQILEFLEGLEAMKIAGKPTPYDHVRQIIVIVVNALSTPKSNWNKSVNGPGSIELLIKATGVPIDHYSYEEIETLKDTQARWNNMRTLRNSPLFAKNKNSALEKIVNTPDIDLFTINVSFDNLEDKDEVAYLNNLPTSFALPAEAVDRLRAAAKKIILASPELQPILNSSNVRLIDQ